MRGAVAASLLPFCKHTYVDVAQAADYMFFVCSVKLSMRNVNSWANCGDLSPRPTEGPKFFPSPTRSYPIMAVLYQTLAACFEPTRSQAA